MDSGYVALVLNAHLPFVRQPDYPHFFEERWLFEAISETYLPLLRVFARLEADHVPWKLTMALSPTLEAMLGDHLLRSRYRSWLESQLELGEREVKRCQGDAVFEPLASMYRDLYQQDYKDFIELYNENLLSAFDFYYKKGRIDLMTSGATGAFMPFYRDYPEAVAAQIEAAVQTFRNSFGRSPTGLWLPQLGWYPGIEETLAAYGLQYSVVSTRGALLGTPMPTYGSYSPVSCPNGFNVFIRDLASTEAVWSPTEGYPADPVYRDFYRDIGFDLPLESVAPFIEQNSIRTFTGFKYWAVTGKDEKVPYQPASAAMKVARHADAFRHDRIEQAKEAARHMQGRPPLMVAPYDAELFGHGWFEGPQWIEALFRKSMGDDRISFTTLGEYARQWQDHPVSVPEYSSWGDGGYGSPWLDKSNDWVYRHTYKMVERMTELAERFPNESGLRERVLNQAAREVLLSQAADWPFLLRAGKSATFARRQLEDSVSNFNRIYEMLCANTVGTEWLTKLEKRNNIFPKINYRVFRRKR